MRICLNQITMDNYDRMKAKLRNLLFGERKTYIEQTSASTSKKDAEELKTKLKDVEIDSEIENIVVETIFRKAAAERIFCGFYASLCSDIVALELQMKGYEAKRINVKHCNFRKNLLSFCYTSFTKMFTLQDQMKKEEDEEKRFKYKEKLFGNIDFIGELYR